MKTGKHTIWRVTKYVLAFALGAVVISEVSVEAIGELWKAISVSWFLVSVCAFYASIYFMALRYWTLVDGRTAFTNILAAVLYQTIMSNLFTTIAGVAWYVGALHHDHDISIRRSLFSLVAARFGDLLMWLMSLSVATFIVWRQVPTLHSTLVLLIFVLSGGILVCAMTVTFRRSLLAFVGGIQFKLQYRPEHLVTRFFKALTEILNREMGGCLRWPRPFVAYSLLTSGSMLLFAYAGLRVFGVTINIWPVVFVVALTQIISFVPVQVFGGLGLYDFTYLYLYGLFGVDRTEFAAVIVGLRICFYLINLGLLPLSLIATKRRKSRLAESNRKAL